MFKKRKRPEPPPPSAAKPHRLIEVLATAKPDDRLDPEYRVMITNPGFGEPYLPVDMDLLFAREIRRLETRIDELQSRLDVYEGPN